MNLYKVCNNAIKPLDEDDESSPLERLKDEYDSWLMYRELADKHNKSIYTSVANDEFRHMLIALTDLLNHVESIVVSDVERNELNSFKLSINK